MLLEGGQWHFNLGFIRQVDSMSSNKQGTYFTNDDEWEWWVSDLIDWTTFQWDKDLICSTLQRFDAEATLRIPLSRRYVPDVLV